MPIPYANVELANTFNHWRVRTNEIITELNTKAVLIGQTATGNAAISGTLTVTTLVATSIDCGSL
jgi:hypothetical protein